MLEMRMVLSAAGALGVPFPYLALIRFEPITKHAYENLCLLSREGPASRVSYGLQSSRHLTDTIFNMTRTLNGRADVF